MSRQTESRLAILKLFLIVMLLVSCAPKVVEQATAPTPQILSATPAPLATARPIVINTRDDLQSITREIAAAEPIAAQARVDELWQYLVKEQRAPLIFGQTVIFFYKGQADRVDWRGTFNSWGTPGLAGQRIGQTDLWVSVAEFPPASRVEYKIVVNDKDWVVDSANPHTAFSGMTGVNNVVTLPGFTVTDDSKKRNDVTPGKLTGEISIASQSLGYAVNYWVYTPTGYENLKQLPVLYVLDGNDFVDERMGAMPNVLDNLIADKRIEPVIAVFVDARYPNNQQFNRREEEFLVHPIEHARFIADELVPSIDRTYRTDPQAAARVIAGVSYGGLSASFIGASRSDVFHNVAAFSPSLWVVANPQYLTNQKQVAGSKLMRPAMDTISQCGGEAGFTCPRLPLKIFMSTGFADWDVGDFAPTALALQQQGYPIEFHRVNEGHSWDNWRGLTDEMLINFFGSGSATSTTPNPVMPALDDTLPDACRVSGQELYVNPYDGYCFAYPSNFKLKMSPIGQPELYGPALDQNLDPLRAVLNMEVEVAVQNADLTLAVDTYLKQFADLNVPPITRTSITFGGEPAVQLEVVPGLAGSRDIFMLHNGTLYHLLFMPSIRDFPQAKADVEELYNAVTHSFSFTSKKPRPLPTP